MGKVIAIRVGRLIGTLFVVTLLTFSLTAMLPGDPVNAILGTTSVRDPDVVASIREEFGLDKPFVERYVSWLGNAIQGDLGKSYVTKEEVIDTIKSRLPITAQLAFMSIVMALLAAVPIGVLGAYKQGTYLDRLSSAGVQLALSVPNFVFAIFLRRILAVQLGWFPSNGWHRLSDGIGENLMHALLPASALALTQLAIFSRLVRSDMAATLQENFVLAARSKGLSDKYILFRHALRPSSLGLMTIVGINFGALLGGTLIIEQIYSIAGLGGSIITAISQRDIITVQGITLFIAVAYITINTLVDVAYTFIDPRIRKR